MIVLAISATSLAWNSSQSTSEKMAVPNLVVDANTVPERVLLTLPGLGPTLSRRIVEAREARPFRSLAEIDRRVSGIGPAKAAAIQPYLRFDPPSIP